MKILLVEDEQRIADFVCSELAERGFRVQHCDRGDTGLAKAREGSFDAIVLDIMLPGRDGLSVLRELRQDGDATPVILLTARNELGDRIQGLENGADDYIAKPFYVEELAARLHALVRRATGDRVNTLHVGDLVLDRMTREVSYRRHTVDLTPREFALLEYLMRSPDRVFTRGQILEHVWGYDFDPTTNVVDVCIRRLRAKLAAIEGAEAESPIESVRGTGYRFRRPA
ncbi:MAG: response regulator transcription factor [Burkholderiales bacterium]